MHLRNDMPMNCYASEVHFPDFEDPVYDGRHHANFLVSHQVEHLYSRLLLDLQDQGTA